MLVAILIMLASPIAPMFTIALLLAWSNGRTSLIAASSPLT